MSGAPEGLEIVETRHQGPVRVTYLARQSPLGRSVQLVGLAPGVLSSSPLARALVHEAEVLARLDHPNIVRLYDLKQDDAGLWLILEDVDGPPLADLIPDKLAWQAVAAIGLDLARALVHAHSVGETHGHLSAHCVQFTKNGRTKLSGFGARPRPDDDQVEALEPQSPGGLSPEGSIGQPVGPLSDLFAWGSLMYELLTTQPPFGVPDDSHYAARVRNDRQKALVLVRPDLPAMLDHLVNQCLEKLPAARPAHAQTLAEQLESLIGSSTLPIIRSELGRLGWRDTEAGELPETGQAPGGRGSTPPPRGLIRFGLPLAAALVGAALAIGGMFAFQKGDEAGKKTTTVATDLPTQDALLLRVVASPWAHVVVDGTHRETTPFATPISLTPGKHVVRLEHPHAAPEERVVEGRAGQTVLLDIQMHVERPLPPDIPDQAPEETTP